MVAIGVRDGMRWPRSSAQADSGFEPGAARPAFPIIRLLEALHHALLGVSVAALVAAGLRAASHLAPGGLARAVAAVVLAAGCAVAEALLLGLVGLGTNAAALTIAALATWGAAVAVLPPQGPSVLRELGSWWTSRTLLERLLVGGLLGAALAWTGWLLRHPSIGFDSSLYHYTLVAEWMWSGRPGSQPTISYGLPFSSYPLTHEVLLAWEAGLARSFVPLALMTPLACGLVVVAGWLGLRELRVRPAVAGLAIAALLSVPWVVRELNEPLGDLTSLSWVVATAALCACAVRHPALLAPAIVAAGLAVGTKTTAAVPTLLVLGLTAFRTRARLPALAPLLGAATLFAAVIGGLWYLRNLIQHGSPAWPFVAAPWGDPVPPFIDLIDTRFVERPLRTLEGRWDDYGSVLAGGVALLAGALLTPVVARSRAVLAAVAAAAIAVIAWALAPVTGLSDATEVPAVEIWSLSTSRYLLPAIACGCLALALATVRGGAAMAWGVAVLVAAIAWNVVEVFGLGSPYIPRLSTLLAGAAAGLIAVALLLLLARVDLPSPARPVRGAAVILTALVAAVAGATLALAADGFLRRHAGVERSSSVDGRRFTAWFVSQPGFEDGDRPVFTAGRFMAAQLAGQRFQHDLELLPRDASCRQVEQAARRGWLVLDLRLPRGVLGVGTVPAAKCRPSARPVYDDGWFRVYSR